MDWARLLTLKTQIPRETGPSSWAAYPVDDFEKDYRELISSEMFRSLQNKTQLFPLVRGYGFNMIQIKSEIQDACSESIIPF